MLALAGAAMIASFSTASAADLAIPPPPPPPPPPIADCCGGPVAGGWYLRGDIGFANEQIDNITPSITVPGLLTLDQKFDANPFFVAAIGYQFNNWFRVDFSGEFRGAANFHGLQTYTNNGGVFPDSYSASSSQWVGLINVFADLGTWWCVTPFVGAGAGFANVTVANFQDTGVVTGGWGSATTATTWNFAWALYAGLAYRVTPNFSVELAYRYLDMGNALTGDLINYSNGQNVGVMNFNHLTSQDIMLGVRWMFEPVPPPEPMMPLVRKG
jgi:opacity protein-like surface antigen